MLPSWFFRSVTRDGGVRRPVPGVEGEDEPTPSFRDSAHVDVPGVLPERPRPADGHETYGVYQMTRRPVWRHATTDRPGIIARSCRNEYFIRVHIYARGG